MDIVFDCLCGRSLKIRDEKLRGRKVKCPACGALVDVPQALVKEEAAVPETKPSSPPQAPVREETPVFEKKESSPLQEPVKEETPIPEKKVSLSEQKTHSHKRPQRRGRREYGTRFSGKGLQPQEMEPRVVGGGAALVGRSESGREEETDERKDKAGSRIASFWRRIFGT